MEENQDADVSQNDTPQADQPQQTNSKPAGYDPVDLSDLPEEKQQALEQRFKYLYGQVKTNDRTLKEYRTVAQQQAAQIEDLMNGVGQVVDHLQNKSTAETESNIRQQLREAISTGDVESQINLTEKLTEIKAKKISDGSKPKPQAQQQQRGPNYAEIARDEMESGEITQDDLKYVEMWQEETDARGQTLRPWAFHDSPFYRNGLRETEAVFTNPKYSQMTVEQKLAEIDRRMGVSKQSPSQGVMGGNLTTRQKTNKVALSPKQQEIAVRTKFGGPKAKSDAEHLEAYRKQIEKVQSGKRSR